MSVHDEVVNQPPPFGGVNLYTTDPLLQRAVQCWDAEWATPRLQAFGALCGQHETLELGVQANLHPPVLHTHDRFGHRVDRVEFHPAWHELMRIAIGHGTHASPWTEPGRGAHVARCAMSFLRTQVDEGHGCPVTMTFAVIPALRQAPGVYERWAPKFLSSEYDPSDQPVDMKRGALCGMGMTERQGGSNVRANTTRAVPLPDGDRYRLEGHKWFFSAPQSDAFLVLAQAPGGLSCFLLPRRLDNGRLNGLRLQRLKDKIGNRSNASSEVEFHGAEAVRIGDEGRGIATIIQMVHHTRLDCCVGSAATLRRAVAEAVHHARYREAFGARLADQPLMQQVLADLCLESAADTLLAMRIAGAFDRRAEDHREQALSRILTAVGKYWICRRAVSGVAEALECTGGNGMVQPSPLARMYTDAPVNSIWEGSGNIQCLDVLRAASREPDSADALLDLLGERRGDHPAYDAALDRVIKAFSGDEPGPASARRITEDLALLAQAGLMIQHAPAPLAEAFCDARLAAERGLNFGTLGPGAPCASIMEIVVPPPDQLPSAPRTRAN